MIFVILLSVLDIIAGILLFEPNYFPHKVIFYVGVILLIKGLYFLGNALGSGSFEWMSAIDVIVGILLLLNVNIGWFALVPLIKGVYCVLLCLPANK